MVDLVQKEMNLVWAETGDIIQPDDTKISNGWDVELVPRQWWNWMQNRVDNNVAYLLQKGFPEWSATVEYIINKSYVQYLNVVYKCIQTHTNQAPAVGPYWVKAFAESSASLEALHQLTVAADNLPYFTGPTSAATTTITAFARSILDDADAVAVRTTIGAQAADATLQALSGLTTGTNKLPYFTGVDSVTTTDLTAFGRSLIDDVDAATARATLELVKQTSQTDATVGSVLTVGAFGWGATSSTPGNTADCNAVNIPGNYLMPVTSPVNAPSGASARGKLVHMGVVADYATQMFFDQGASNRVWLRTGNNSTWRAWVEIWTSGNLVKTTSATDTTSGRVWRTDDLVKTTSATDTTAGRMLKVGDFGFNGPSIAAIANADLNWAPFAKTPANARFQGYSWVNMPGGLATALAVVEWQSYSGDWGRQLFVDILNNKSYERYWYSGTTWSPWVEVATSANSLGQTQVWQNVAGIRALQTTYTNTTGRPIEICVTTYNTTGTGSVSLNIDGVTLGFNQTPLAGSYTSMSAVVPVGGQYLATNGGAQSTLYAWSELR